MTTRTNGKPQLIGSMKDSKPLHRPIKLSCRDWFTDITPIIKCQVCGIISDHHFSYLYPSTDSYATTAIYALTKFFKCSTCSQSCR